MSRHGKMEAAAVCALPTTRGFNGAAATWLFGLFLATLCFVFAGAAHSATYYVSTSGNNSNAGTSSAPWRTIQYAVLAVSPGDTVMINDGTYGESVKLDEMKKGTSPITLQAVNARKAILSPGGGNGFYDDYSPLQNLKIIGMKIQNGRVGMEFTVGGNGIEINNCEISGFIEGIRIRQGQNIHILDSYVHDNQNGVLLGVKDVSGIQNILVERTVAANNTNGGNTDGFMVEGMCQNLVFRDCVAYGSGDTGFDCKPDNTILERCKTYNNNGWGVKFWGIGSKAINCIIYGNKLDGIGCSQYNLSFIGCTFGPNGNNGLTLETSNIGTCVVRNNIFYNTTFYTHSSSRAQEDYNTFYNTSGGYVIRSGNTTYTSSQVQSHVSGVGSHDVGKDPMFTSPGTADYRLNSGSPSIGAGIADSLMTLDFNSKTRLNPPDMGALAANTGTSTPTVPTAPTTVSINNGSTATTADDLTAAATGSTVSSGTITYQFQWAKSTDGGSTWGAWGNTGATLAKANLADGQTWKAHARATVDGSNFSAWTESATCTISSGTATLAAPTAVTVTPASPADTDNLIVVATGGGTAGSTPSYEYDWARSTDSGATWGAWGNSGSVLLASNTQPGDKWKARARAVEGTNFSAWVPGNIVTIAGTGGGTTVPAPRQVTINPTSPTDADDLLAQGFGGGLVSTDTYQSGWARSTDGGATWGAWTTGGARLPNASTSAGDRWKARMRVVHGTDYSAWTESTAVAIPGTSATKPVTPTSVKVTPATPTDSSALTATATSSVSGASYEYKWRKQRAGTSSWSAWGNAGQTLSASLTTVGDRWQATARMVINGQYSSWKTSNTVKVIADPKATTGIKVAINPSTPTDSQNLVANATGTYTAGQSLYFEYNWSRSTDGGSSWSGWNWCTKTLPASETQVGDKWRVSARGHDGQVWGTDVVGPTVTVR